MRWLVSQSQQSAEPPYSPHGNAPRGYHAEAKKGENFCWGGGTARPGGDVFEAIWRHGRMEKLGQRRTIL